MSCVAIILSLLVVPDPQEYLATDLILPRTKCGVTRSLVFVPTPLPSLTTSATTSWNLQNHRSVILSL